MANLATRQGRNLQRSRMWESGVVPYVVSDVFDKDQRCAIANAMADIMGAAGPCVKFVPRQESVHALSF